MVFIIGGHPRSGTTLLRNLCDAHPAITVTMEFNNFTGIGKSSLHYSYRMLKMWWRNRERSFLVQGKDEENRRYVLQSHAFVLRYLWETNKRPRKHIQLSDIEKNMRSVFPESKVVGDKFPAYIFRLDKIVSFDEALRVVVYRDCRDVVSSSLKIAQTKWRNRPFAAEYDTAQKIAQRWVYAIEQMEKHASHVFIIRYEDLVRNPSRELGRLGEQLDVPLEGFPLNTVKTGSVGKYKQGLTTEELAAVMDIAGPTMNRLGYA